MQHAIKRSDRRSSAATAGFSMASPCSRPACLLLFLACALVAAVDLVEAECRLFQPDPNSPSPAPELLASVSKQAATDTLECALLCAMRPDCLTFGYSTATSECQMSNEEPGGLASSSNLKVFNSGLRRRAAAGSSCSRGVVATKDGRRFCPIQQRVSDSDFQQPWSSYEAGFGDNVNFWIGLQAINQLSSKVATGVIILVQFITWKNESMYQEYDSFIVQTASTSYTMTVGPLNLGKSNYLADKLGYLSGMKFSTKDRDNDLLSGSSCSTLYHGNSGWWYRACSYCNPNGLFVLGEMVDPMYMSWKHDASWTSLKAIRMSLIDL